MRNRQLDDVPCQAYWQSSRSNLARQGKNSFWPRFSSLPCEIQDNENSQRHKSASSLPPRFSIPLSVPSPLLHLPLVKHPSHSLFPWLPLQAGENFLATQLCLRRPLLSPFVSLLLMSPFTHNFFSVPTPSRHSSVVSYLAAPWNGAMKRRPCPSEIVSACSKINTPVVFVSLACEI